MNPAYDDPITVTNTRIFSDRNSNKKILVNKNPAYQDIQSIQPNTLVYMRMHNKQLFLFMRL